MGLLDPVNYADARLQPGALIAQVAPYVRLAEVRRVERGYAYMEDCKTDAALCERAWNVVRQWKLIRPAPTAPDLPPQPHPSPLSKGAPT